MHTGHVVFLIDCFS